MSHGIKDSQLFYLFGGVKTGKSILLPIMLMNPKNSWNLRKIFETSLACARFALCGFHRTTGGREIFGETWRRTRWSTQVSTFEPLISNPTTHIILLLLSILVPQSILPMRRNRPKTAVAGAAGLPPDMLANIHGRLSLLDRLAFAAAFRASCDAFKPEAPCLVLPGDALAAASLFSLADRCGATVLSPDADHVVLGSSSSRGWLVTADGRAQLRLVNPVTGERHALPAIDTIPCLNANCGRHHFTFRMMWFLRGPPPYPYGAVTLRAEEMRHFLYRKVVLSDSADVAMLITGPEFGVAAFATAAGGSWRLALPRDDGVEPVAAAVSGPWSLAHSRNGIKDAIHYNGMFYSITYLGEVEAWEECGADDPGVFASAVIAPRLLLPADMEHRKYLMAAPGGRLMVVLKEGRRTSPSFKVQVLGAGGEEWKVTDDIGETALFVGGNGSLCVSTREHPELKAGCIYYYTEDDLGPYKDARDDEDGVGVFSLKDGSLEKVEGLGWHRSWPPPAWFIGQ